MSRHCGSWIGRSGTERSTLKAWVTTHRLSPLAGKSDETVSVVEIATGTDEGSWIEVLSPLQPGQLVVDAHRERFKEGQAVRVLPPR